MVYCGGTCSGPQNVGSKSPKGDGRWGQSDLAGNVWEWNLDWYGDYVNPCNDCANLVVDTHRSFRSGTFLGDESALWSAYRYNGQPGGNSFLVGTRCARNGL